MKARNSVSAEAAEFFKAGYNCAQSILLAMQKFWKIKKPLEPRVASAFGGGIGRSGSVCGALTGGVIAIGLKYGTNKPWAVERARAYSLALRFINQFKEDSGGVLCRELIGYDLSSPEGLEKARRAGVFRKRCDHIIENTVELLINLNRR